MCLLIAIPLVAIPNRAGAQQAPPNDGNVFVLTIDDAMIDALKRGMSLESQVPEDARGKFKTIRIQYKPAANQAAPENSILRNSETTQNSSANPSGTVAGGANPPPLATPSSGAWGNLPAGTNPTNPTTPLNLGLPPNAGQTQSPTNSQTNLTTPPLRLDQWNRELASNQPAGDAKSSPITVPTNSSWFGPWRDPSTQSVNAPSVNAAPTLPGNLGQVPATANLNGMGLSGFPQRSEVQALPNTGFGGSLGLPPQSIPPTNYRNELVSSTASEMARSIEEYWSRGNGQLTLPPPPTGNAAATNAPDADRSPSDSVGRLPIPTSDAEKTLMEKVSALETANKTLEQQRKESTKWTLFLFLFLMCSLGANLYLGWIARGFYTRFHEMANELRDTFTSAAV